MGASTLMAIYAYQYHKDKFPHVVAEREYLRRKQEQEKASAKPQE
jgi:hypothetical protein